MNVKHFKAILFLLLFLTSYFTCESQVKYDSLKTQYQLFDYGNKKILRKKIADTLNETGIVFWNQKKYAEAERNLEVAITLSKEIKYYKAIAAGLNNLGLVYYEQGKYAEGLDLYKQSIGIFDKIGNEKASAQVQLNLGILYKKHGLYEKSSQYLIQAVQLFEKNDQKKELASSYNSLAGINDIMGNYDESLKYHFLALEIRREIDNAKGIAGSLNNIGAIYKNINELDSALHYYQTALNLKIGINEQGLKSSSYLNIGKVYFALQKYQEAESYYLQSLDLKKAVKDHYGVVLVSNALGELYLTQKKYKKARQILLNAGEIANRIDGLKLKKENYYLLGELFNEINDYQKAMEYNRSYSNIKDSLFNKSRIRALTDMQVKYETEKKEQKILSLNRINEIQSDLINLRTKVLYIVIFAALLFMVLTVISYMGFTKAKKAKLRIRTLMDERHHRAKNNRQILASVLNLQSVQISDEKIREAIKAGEDRVHAISIVDRILFHNEISTQIYLNDYLVELIESLFVSYGYDECLNDLDMHIDDILIDSHKVVSIGLIVNELVTNTLKYAFTSNPEPRLVIKLEQKKDSSLLLKMYDNGPGLPKSFELEKSPSFGLKLVNSLVKQLKGEIRTTSKTGLSYVIWLDIK